jgi:uncharacterized repeat protein (TIGR03803 family)
MRLAFPSRGDHRACREPPLSRSLAVLHYFQGGSDGELPDWLDADTKGNIFGSTYSGGIANAQKTCGTIFDYTPATRTYKVIYSSNGVNDGAHPMVGAVGADGTIYGATDNSTSFPNGTLSALTPGPNGYTYSNLAEFHIDGNAVSFDPPASIGTDTLAGNTSQYLYMYRNGKLSLLQKFIQTIPSNGPLAPVTASRTNFLYGAGAGLSGQTCQIAGLNNLCGEIFTFKPWKSRAKNSWHLALGTARNCVSGGDWRPLLRARFKTGRDGSNGVRQARGQRGLCKALLSQVALRLQVALRYAYHSAGDPLRVTLARPRGKQKMQRFLIATCVTILLAGPAANAATPPGFVTGAFAGQPDSAGILPNFNKVPGTTDQNIDIPVPQAVLTHGLTYDYIVTWETDAYSGPCTVEYTLTQIVNGTKKTLDAAKIASLTCASGGAIYLYYNFGKPVANSPGPATLTGVVQFGTTKVTLNTPVIIQ